MSYATLPPDMREIAERVLTKRQLHAFKLWCQDFSYVRISVMLDVSEPRARMLVRRAQQKIKLEMEEAA